MLPVLILLKPYGRSEGTNPGYGENDKKGIGN